MKSAFSFKNLKEKSLGVNQNEQKKSFSSKKSKGEETTVQSKRNTRNVVDFLSIKTPEKEKETNIVMEALIETIIETLDASGDNLTAGQAKIIINKTTRSELKNVIANKGVHLSVQDREFIQCSIIDEVLGYGPFEQFLRNPDVSEIMLNPPNNMFVESKGLLYPVPIRFRDEEHIYHIISRMLEFTGRRVDESSPKVDTRLPDGSRVNIIIPPSSMNGPAITIRKFAAEPFTMEKLIAFGALSKGMDTFLKSCMTGKMNMIVSGGTGGGKTTLLNALSGYIPDDDRIITIEDDAELQLQQRHVVSLESRPENVEGKGAITIRDLLINALRMRPDRFIVGEVRGGETLDMLQLMNTGHDGSLTTTHANTPRDCISRLETMVHMSGVELPVIAIRQQIASAIDFIIQVSRFADGSRKIEKVSEVVGIEGDVVVIQDIFVYEQIGFAKDGTVIGEHMATGIMPSCIKTLRNRGAILPEDLFVSDLKL